MTSLMSLVIPTIVSAVFVFIASSVIHMATKWHNDEYPMVPNQGKIMDAIKALGLPPGDYMFPKPKDMADMKSPEFVAMAEKGPLTMTLMPAGPMAMGPTMANWFLYSVIVSLFAGYVASAALPPGTAYLKVFQIVGTSAFMAYAFALWPLKIWYRRSTKITVKATIDGLVYALLTAGTFGWLWPKG